MLQRVLRLRWLTFHLKIKIAVIARKTALHNIAIFWAFQNIKFHRKDLILIIHLPQNIVIDADKYQFIVGTLKTRTDKDGKELQYIANPHYCGKQISKALQTAMEIILLQEVETNTLQTLDDYVTRLKALSTELQQTLGLLEQIEVINWAWTQKLKEILKCTKPTATLN